MKINFAFFLSFAFFLFSIRVRGQDSLQSPEHKLADDIVADSSIQRKGAFDKELDLIDLYQRIIKKNAVPRKENNNPHLSMVPAVGYTEQTEFAAVISSNIGFYTMTGNHDTQKISSILTSIAYSQKKQIIFPIQADIWTKNNEYNIIADWRYLNYPSITFGLGGRANINHGNGYTIDFEYTKIHQTLLKKFASDLYAGIGFYYDYFWNVREVDPPAGVVTSFQKYGLTKTVTASGLAFRFLLDSRKNQINPDGGWYVNVIDRPNFKFMGSDANWQSLLIEARSYFHLSASSKNVLAVWSYNWLTVDGTPPYLLLPSTGWDDFYNTGRGYIQGRFRGRDMIYLETEYRFAITHNRLLGAVVFANAQSVSRFLSKELQIIAPAVGAGIRIKLNKFSGANLCIDYGVGINGQQGISVNLGEVF
ncbi:MAG: BamA/TamA family outer membrane protein [Bacteroidetes bacterium]|nr:BamA/TamA family outer membrane protein [Bacteroidota bacterium]